jgi:hypothetical protein
MPRAALREPISSPVFRPLPQASLVVHSFRTAAVRFPIALNLEMREIAITAGVNVTQTVIGMVGSAAVNRELD